MTTNEQHSKIIRDAIRTVFNNDWDPIEIMDDDSEFPENEYDDYIDGMQEILVRNESVEVIAQYLYNVETDCIGTSASDGNVLQAAEKLKAINISNIG